MQLNKIELMASEAPRLPPPSLYKLSVSVAVDGLAAQCLLRAQSKERLQTLAADYGRANHIR